MKIYFYWIIILSCISIQAQNKKEIECEKFHTGKFKLIDKDFDTTFLIERDAKYQIEKNLKTGEITKGKIAWINDCTYTIHYLESDDEIVKNTDHTNDLKIEIIESKNNSYKFRATKKGVDLVYIDEIEKIE